MSTEDEDAADVARERDYWLGKLAGITADRKRLDTDERIIVKQARFAGIGWDEIAGLLGISSGKAAQDKFGEPGPGDKPF